jgi:hypothetical protein
MSQAHQLSISVTPGQTLASWAFDGVADLELCQVNQGDTIEFSFDGNPTIAECVLISGQLGKGSSRSPFNKPSPINLEAKQKLTVGKTDGLWGFMVAFSITNADGTTSFYCLPDPELQVGST